VLLNINTYFVVEADKYTDFKAKRDEVVESNVKLLILSNGFF